MSWTRRAAIGGAAASFAAPVLANDLLGSGAEFGWATADMSGRLGASVNADGRFPMCSTFKWLLAACVLSRIDKGIERLHHRLGFGPADIQNYAPTAKAALMTQGGVRAALSIDALCEAAVTLSDNNAANLLLGSIGGPADLTAWLRAHGDAVTRLDRIEPALNRVPLGDARDTTTPAAMVGELHRILLGDVLSHGSRRRLLQWMLDCKTGETRLKAGLPSGWRIAQKTGTWTYDPTTLAPQRAASGNLGVLFPPNGEPILIAAYTADSTRPQADVDLWFAELARRITSAR